MKKTSRPGWEQVHAGTTFDTELCHCAEGRTHLLSIMGSCSQDGQDGVILTASSSAVKFIKRSVDYLESPGHWRRFYC